MIFILQQNTCIPNFYIEKLYSLLDMMSIMFLYLNVPTSKPLVQENTKNELPCYSTKVFSIEFCTSTQLALWMTFTLPTGH